LVQRFMDIIVAEAIKFDLDVLFGHLRCSGNAPDLSDRAAAAQGHANALLEENYDPEDVLDVYNKVSTPLAELEAAYLGLLLWVKSKLNTDDWTLLKFVWDRVPGDSFGWGPKAVLREEQGGKGVDAIHYVVLKHSANGFTEQANIDRIQKLGEIFLEFQPSERGQVFSNEETHDIITLTENVGASKIELLDIVVGREYGKTLEEMIFELVKENGDEIDKLEKNFRQLGQQIFHLFFQHEQIDAFGSRPLLGFVQSDKMNWPRLRPEQDSITREMMDRAKTAPIPVPIRYCGDRSYTLLHGDEWGRNFVAQSTETGRLRPIDFEDVHIKEVQLDQDRTVSEIETFDGAGGDLAKRIENRYPPRIEAFSSAGAAGRLMTALLQKLSRDRDESASHWVKRITMPMIAGADEALEGMLEQFSDLPSERILLHKGLFAQFLLSMADWSAYWSEKGARAYWNDTDRDWLSRCIDLAWGEVSQRTGPQKFESSGEFNDIIELMNKEYEEHLPPRMSQNSPKSHAEEIFYSLKKFYDLLPKNIQRAEELREKIKDSVAEFESSSPLKIIFQQELTLIQLGAKNYEEGFADFLNVLDTLASLESSERHSKSLIEGLERRALYWAMNYNYITFNQLPNDSLDSTIDFADQTLKRLDRLFLRIQDSQPELTLFYLFHKEPRLVEIYDLLQLRREQVGEKRIDLDPIDMHAIFTQERLEYTQNHSEKLSGLSLSKAKFIERRTDLQYRVHLNLTELNNNAIVPLLEIWSEVRRLPESGLRDHFLLQILHTIWDDFTSLQTPLSARSISLVQSFLPRIMECNIPPRHLDPAMLFDLLLLNVLRFPLNFSEHENRLNALNVMLQEWWNPLERPASLYSRSTRSVEPELFRALVFRVLISYLPNISIHEVENLKIILHRIILLDISNAWSTQSKEMFLSIDLKERIEQWLDGTLDIKTCSIEYPNPLVQLLNDVLVGFVISEDAGGAVRRRGVRSHQVYQALEEQFGRPTDIHRRW
jgi:hypothetical protein